jgi:hypothetical protein
MLLNNFISIGFIKLALYQWAIIGERTNHAIWVWRKFAGSGGGGCTTMNFYTLILGYIVSILTILIALLTRRYFAGNGLRNF